MAVPQRSAKILKCLKLLQDQNEFKLVPLDESTMLEAAWAIRFCPPSGSPYGPEEMEISLGFPPRFPFEPPSVTFSTSVYHPNIDTSGKICLDLLKPLPTGSWKPSIDIITLLTAVKLLLAEPNPDDPLMPDIAAEYRENRQLYLSKARNGAVVTACDSKTVEENVQSEVKERRSLLKRKSDSVVFLEQGTNEPFETPQTVQLNTNVMSEESKEEGSIGLVSVQSFKENSEPINLASDEDEFEVKPKKARLLSTKKL